MDLKEAKKGNATVVSLSGRIDSSVAKEFEAGLIGVVDKGAKKVVVDFANLDYISSAGLRVLLMAAKQLKAAGGGIALCAMQPSIKEVFEVSGFSQMLPISDTVDKAIKSI